MSTRLDRTQVGTFLVAALCLAALVLSFALKPSRATLAVGEATVVINITEQGFTPSPITVEAGQPVQWVNRTNRPLTISDQSRYALFLPVTARGTGALAPAAAAPASTTQPAAPLFQQIIQPGASFTFTFNEVRDYAIYIRELAGIFGRIVLVPPPGGQVKGYVYANLRRFDDRLPADDEFTHVYLPDIQVFLRNAANVEVSRVRSDLSGRFSFPHLKAGTYTLCWTAPGYAPACSNQAVVLTNKSLQLGEFAVSPMKVSGMALIYGKATLGDHSNPRTFEPYANVNAFARMRLRDAATTLGEAFVNNYGQFIIPQAPTNFSLWLEGTLEKEEGERTIRAGAMTPGQALRVDMPFANHRPRLESLAPTVGGEYTRVVAPGGQLDLHADATDADGDALAYYWILPAASGQLSSPTGSAVTWTLPNVEALHPIYLVIHDGRGGYNISTVTIETNPDGVQFSGRVVTPAGTGVGAAAINVNGVPATTNPNGYFSLRAPRADEYVLDITKSGFAPLSRIYLDGQIGGLWTLTPATVITVDPTQPIDIRDDKRVCPGAVSQRIPWDKYPNQNTPRYQDGQGNVIRVGAAGVDFEDLTLNTTYVVGNQFTDSDTEMVVRPFFFANGQPHDGGVAVVGNDQQAGGSGQELNTNNVNLEFLLDDKPAVLTLRYGEYGGNVNLRVNGELANTANFDDLDGETVGGALIRVTGSGPKRTLRVAGEIGDFAIGGQELWIDDIAFDPIERLPRELPCGPGMRVRIPANSLVDAGGNPPPGLVQLTVGTYDILSPDGLPGDYTAEDTGGATRTMESFGAGSVQVSDATRSYNLRAGATAVLSIPAASIHFEYDRPLPPAIPRLLYNRDSGIWDEGGQWTLSGTEYVATVDHFSEFNVDLVKVGQACVKIYSPDLPASYRLEITIPQGEDAAPAVVSGVVDNSQPYHVIYNLPTGEEITLTAIEAAQDIPIGTFVVNTGGPQNPTDPNRPAPPYNACDAEVSLYDPGIQDPPSLDQPVANSFLHGLYSFYGTSFDDQFTEAEPLNGAIALDFATATSDYYEQIDPHDLRETFAEFQSQNGFPAGEIRVVYANSADLGFGRDMHCRRTEVTPGVFDVACYVSNYGTGYQNYENGGGYGTDDGVDFQNAANGVGLVATVAMEYTRVEDPLNVNAFISPDRIVKFYVYVNDERVDGRSIASGHNPNNIDTGNAFVDLDGFGGRPLPQLCLVCHGGSVQHSGPPSPTNPPVFGSFDDVDMGSVFLPFDLNSFTIVDGFTPTGGVLGQYDKANQQAEFRDLNQLIVHVTQPGGPIDEVIDEMYAPLGNFTGAGNQIQNFVVAGWDAEVAHQAMYREVMTPACRACHVAQVNAVGPTFQTAADVLDPAPPDLPSLIRLRVCVQRVMPHARATFDRFWNSVGPHQPAQLISWGTVYAPALDWTVCGAPASGGPPIPDLVVHEPLIQQVWTNNCTGCHPPNGGLDLTAGNAFDNIRNVPSSQVPARDRIEPNSTANSYIWEKLTDSTPTVGSQMPLGGSLGATDLDLIEQWILDNALEGP